MAEDKVHTNGLHSERPVSVNGKVGRGLSAQGPSNATLQTSSRGSPTASGPGTMQNPPWTTCFVETEDAGRPVLEEWIMRGESGNVNAFRAWRQHGSDPVSVRCEPAAVRMSDSVTCIECLSRSTAPAPNARGVSAVAIEQVQVATTFVGLDKCFTKDVGGTNFCKSGRVVVPV